LENNSIFSRIMKISTEQKLDNYRNMVGMISDYEKQYSRWPTTKEFAEKLNMAEPTVRKYKRDILAQDRKELFDSFNYEIIIYTKKTLSSIKRNIKDCEKIYDNPEDNTEKMDTGRRILDYHLDAIKIMRDIPIFLGGDNVQSEQEHIHRQADSENTTEGFESINN